jgi:hypothetical protein
MNRFIETKFFLMMEEYSLPDLSASVMENACEEFACFLFAESDADLNRVAFLHILCLTQVELATLHSQLSRLKKECACGFGQSYFIDR